MSGEHDDEEYLTTREAAEALGVGPSTVKRWADQGVLQAVRTLGRHRRYRRAAVERIAARGRVPASPGSHTVSARPGRPEDPDEWIRVLLASEDQYEVTSRLLRARGQHGSWWSVADALGAVLEEIGRRWLDGRLEIAEEHQISTSLARGLAWISSSLPTDRTAPRALLATAAQDDHTLGLSLVEPVFRESGWRPVWLGRYTPTDVVVRTLETTRIDLVALTATCEFEEGSLRQQAETIAAATSPRNVPLLLGGSGPWPRDLEGAVRLDSCRELATQLAL
jgi:excisionase family DNA binding protein